jgi:hypothetical protein
MMQKGESVDQLSQIVPRIGAGQFMDGIHGRTAFSLLAIVASHLDRLLHLLSGFRWTHLDDARARSNALLEAKKKPTWSNTKRYSTTSAYSLTSPPARPDRPLSSHPTTSIPALIGAD